MKTATSYRSNEHSDAPLWASSDRQASWRTQSQFRPLLCPSSFLPNVTLRMVVRISHLVRLPIRFQSAKARYRCLFLVYVLVTYLGTCGQKLNANLGSLEGSPSMSGPNPAGCLELNYSSIRIPCHCRRIERMNVGTDVLSISASASWYAQSFSTWPTQQYRLPRRKLWASQ
jgi:hypothetical protein